jgi:hypothetical protein
MFGGVAMLERSFQIAHQKNSTKTVIPGSMVANLTLPAAR